MAKPESISAAKAQSFLKKIKFEGKFSEEANLLYYPSSAKISGDLELNDKDVLLVDGDLDVSGGVFDVGANNEDDYGYLLLKGTLSCDALIWGGSFLVANGGISARKFVYFNGWGMRTLEAGAKLETPILMSEDNEIIAKTIVAERVYVRNPSAWGDEAEALAPGKIPRKFFKKDFVDVDQLRKAAKDKRPF